MSEFNTRCRSPGSFASAWPELIIAYEVRKRGEAWPKLMLACDVSGRGIGYYRQTDRRTDITTWLHIASFAFTGAHAGRVGSTQF